MDNQFAIKIILIVLFLAFGLVLLLPTRGARRLAIRRIVLLLTTLAGIVAIAFPELVNELANLLGVGRGTDLILYALVVVFIGNSISSSIRHRQLEREVTMLARTLAIDAAPSAAAHAGDGDGDRADRDADSGRAPEGDPSTGAGRSTGAASS